VPAGPTAPGSSPPWPGVERHDDQAVGLGGGQRRRATSAPRAARPGRGGVLRDQLAERIARAGPSGCGQGGRRRAFLQALGDQRFQRIGRLRREEVDHQPVLVGGHRRQVEHLRHAGLLQVDVSRTVSGAFWVMRMPAM
jgi:hypothetical protein